MKKYRLNAMQGGWFIGNFTPSCIQLKECEIACKHYLKGEREERHVHKVATEITLIAFGAVLMNEVRYNVGDIVTLDPGEDTDFTALEDAMTVVVKIPSVPGDKYLVKNEHLTAKN